MDAAALPQCRYGASCYRKNPDHLAKFAHPPKTTGTAAVKLEKPKDRAPPEASSVGEAVITQTQTAVSPAVVEASITQSSPVEKLAETSSAILEYSGKRIVLILVGVAGSGKSTFCHKLSENASQPWTRICQDVIANGKRGTKAQCLKQAEWGLQLGSVMIDRCNLSKEQRSDFLELSKKPNTQVHAVVLNLPVGKCITRAMQRTSHEGDLQGKNAAAIVQRMARELEMPTLQEGFERITICGTDSEVDNAITLYKQFDSSTNIPSGVFGSSNIPPKVSVKGTLDNFLAKPKEVTKEEKSDHSQSTGKLEEATLAFPSLSTADFQFDHEKAADIIVETASNFLNCSANDGLKLLLVDLSSDSDMLLRVRNKWASLGLDDKRFSTYAGDITKLKSTGAPMSSVIANAANWRLKGGGGGVNMAIFKAAGEGFEEATKQKAKTLNTGSAVAVPLTSSSTPLYDEGVRHVIHVLGPNMNPLRPNCLNGDYDEGCKQLRQAYTSLFRSFSSVAKRGKSSPPLVNQSTAATSGGDAFSLLMSKRKNGQGDNDDDSKHKRGKNDDNGIAERKKWPAWAQALRDIALNPDKHTDVILEVGDDTVVIMDSYPKARKHALVICRIDGLDCLADVRTEHLPLLRQMHSVGERWAKKFMEENNDVDAFRVGYHWKPSMQQLHMHVISQDLDSQSMKNKKHWNSFTSEFFRDSKDVMKEVEENGRVKECSEEIEQQLLNCEFRCHRCRCVQPNLGKLKTHLSLCSKPFPFQDKLI